MGAVSSRLDAGAARSGKRGKQEQGWRGCFSEEVRAACCSSPRARCRVPPSPFASPHLTDLPTAARPDCLPFFHIICMATACIGILIIPTSFCRVTLPWEVRWRSSTWPATGERELAWRDQPQINQNRRFGCPAFLSEGCCGLTPVSSSEPPAAHFVCWKSGCIEESIWKMNSQISSASSPTFASLRL